MNGCVCVLIRHIYEGFPGGSAGKSPPANGKRHRLSPGPGGSTWYGATEPRATTIEPVLQSRGAATTEARVP